MLLLLRNMILLLHQQPLIMRRTRFNLDLMIATSQKSHHFSSLSNQTGRPLMLATIMSLINLLLSRQSTLHCRSTPLPLKPHYRHHRSIFNPLNLLCLHKPIFLRLLGIPSTLRPLHILHRLNSLRLHRFPQHLQLALRNWPLHSRLKTRRVTG